MKLDAKVGKLALALVKVERERYAAYDEVVADYRRQGYRPARCIHGRYLWGESDIPCGACEDGEGYWDYLRVTSYAIFEAKQRLDEHNRRIVAYWAVAGVDPKASVLADLRTWVCAPLDPEERV